MTKLRSIQGVIQSFQPTCYCIFISLLAAMMVETDITFFRGPTAFESVHWKLAKKAIISIVRGREAHGHVEHSRMSQVCKTDSGLIFTDRSFANCHRNARFMKVFSCEINLLYGSADCLFSTVLVVAWNWQGCL